MTPKPKTLTDAALRNLDDAAFAGEVNGALWVASRYFAGPVTGEVGRYWRAHAAKCAPIGPSSPESGSKISFARHYSASEAGAPNISAAVPTDFEDAPLDVYRFGDAPLCMARPAAEGLGAQILLTAAESETPVCAVNLRMLSAVIGLDELGALDALTLPQFKLQKHVEITLHRTLERSETRALTVKRWSTAVRADTHKTEVYGSVVGIVMPCRIKTGG